MGGYAYLELPGYPQSPIDVACPYATCEASPGSRCHTGDGRKYGSSYYHEARFAALDGAQKMARSFEAVFNGALLFGKYEEE
jgi:hypothetical protein